MNTEEMMTLTSEELCQLPETCVAEVWLPGAPPSKVREDIPIRAFASVSFFFFKEATSQLESGVDPSKILTTFPAELDGYAVLYCMRMLRRLTQNFPGPIVGDGQLRLSKRDSMFRHLEIYQVIKAFKLLEPLDDQWYHEKQTIRVIKAKFETGSMQKRHLDLVRRRSANGNVENWRDPLVLHSHTYLVSYLADLRDENPKDPSVMNWFCTMQRHPGFQALVKLVWDQVHNHWDELEEKRKQHLGQQREEAQAAILSYIKRPQNNA